MASSRSLSAPRRAPSALVLALGLAIGLPSQAQDAATSAPTAAASAPSVAAGIAEGAPAMDTVDSAGQDAAGASPAATGSATDEPPSSTDAADGTASTADASGTPPPSTAADSVATGEPGTPTAAEDDFDALYGDAAGDEAIARPAAYDPWERYNRRMHRFNNAVDRRVARPLAKAYVRAVPTPVRAGVSNFFSNLGQPVSAVNALLQGKPRQAAHSLGRFVLNSTLGIGGVFDPATAAKLENRSEDFGQTLGVWGWRRSRYVELPLFGPRTLRDVLGMAGDAPLSPLRQVDADKIRVPLQGMQLVDLRAQLLSTDALREGVEDDYILVRDAWSQRRDYHIMGDREAKDEDPTVVPVDAMPVTIDN